jgi:hypothetical protein
MTEKTMTKCLADINKAHDDALKVAAGLYPAGTRVGVMLSCRQRVPSPATIRGHRINTSNFGTGTSSYVEIRVEMDNAKSHRSRYQGVSADAIRAADSQA